MGRWQSAGLTEGLLARRILPPPTPAATPPYLNHSKQPENPNPHHPGPKKPPRSEAIRRWQRKALTKEPNAPPPPLHHRLRRRSPSPCLRHREEPNTKRPPQILPVAKRWGGGPLAQRVVEGEWQLESYWANIASYIRAITANNLPGFEMNDIDKGSIETAQMFEMIGRAITGWSFVEERLSAIFMVCTTDVVARPEGGLDFGEVSVSQAVFFAVESFRGKLNLVDAAVSARLHEGDQWALDLNAEWRRLHDKARKLSLKRNKLAHYTVLPGHDFDDRTISPRLVPPYGSPGYYRETGVRSGAKTLKLLHLTHLEQAFHLLQSRLRDFAYRLARQDELFELHVQRLARRIRAHSKTDPQRAEKLRLMLASIDQIQ
jgi:hypothetical protein